MGTVAFPALIVSLSEGLAILGAALIVAIIGFAAYQYARRYGSGGRILGDRCRETLSRWAASRGLEFDDRLLRIEGAANGVDVLVTATYDQIEWSLPPSIMMSTVSAYPLPFVVQVATSWFSLEEQVAHHRAQTGDRSFDAKYKLWSDPPEAAMVLMVEEVRRMLIDLDADELLYDRGIIELRWDDEFVDSVERAAARMDVAFTLVLALASSHPLPAPTGAAAS